MFCTLVVMTCVELWLDLISENDIYKNNFNRISIMHPYSCDKMDLWWQDGFHPPRAHNTADQRHWCLNSLFLLYMYSMVQYKARKYTEITEALKYAFGGHFDYVNYRILALLHGRKWSTVQERYNYFTALLMYKSINDAIVMANDIHDRDTRLANSIDFHVPPHKFDTMKRSFMYTGSVIWNNPPSNFGWEFDPIQV